MKLKALTIAIICLVLLSSCTGNSFINSSSEEAVIKVKGSVFNITVDNCIKTLNGEIKSEGLPLIPTDYEIVKHDGWTEYKAKVSDYIMIRLVTYNDEGKGLARIGLSVLDSFDYKNGDKRIHKTISKEEKKISKEYYEIICQKVKPNFNAKPFMEYGENNGHADFELDEMYFLSNHPSIIGQLNTNDAGSGTEDITVYEVISSKALYKKYEDTIIGDGSIYFYF